MAKASSAGRHARSSERRRLRNRAVKSRIHTLERKFLELVEAGKKEEAAAALSHVFSALDKAAKTKVIHRNTAARKKSRLSQRLAMKAA